MRKSLGIKRRFHYAMKNITELNIHFKGWDGMRGGREVKEGGGISIPMAD